MKGNLDGKTALITGGSSGIGLATAILFAEEGARVAIASRSPQKGKSALKEISTFSNRDPLYIQADVGKPADVRRMVKTVIDELDGLDILFCNSGVNKFGPVVEMKEKDWNEIIRNNLTSVFLCCKYSLPYMIEQRKGSIICSASTYSIVGKQNFGAYSATKGAILTFAKSLALETAGYNIRVNCVCPSTVETPMVLKYWTKLGNPNHMRKLRTSLHPLGRLAVPRDVAEAVLYLASDQSSFVTGSQIVIDGGYTAQ